jgi:anaerobic magnesium-protoporphyrin IX monomethyl ester cyclase
MARVACVFSVERYNTVKRPLPGWHKVPFGLSIVAACLEHAGHEVRCWVICPDSQLASVAHEIDADFGAEMVAASAVTTQFPLILRLCEQIKRRKASISILLGGVHATIRPEQCIRHTAIDGVCVGEGETVAIEWAKAISAGARPSRIQGTWIKIPGRAEAERTPPAQFHENLDALPLMNYSHWARWIDPEDRTLRVVIGRGCPNACTYCSNHALRRIQTGRYVRFRSPGNIRSEIEMLLKRFQDLKSINLEIETIGASVPWALKLCDALAELNAGLETPIAFRSNLAVTSQLVQAEEKLHALLGAFRRANLRTLDVGLESGSARIRHDILNRPAYTNDELIRFCRLAHAYGIEVSLYTLMGVPTETVDEALATSAVARACAPADIAPSIFYPYPGTMLYELSAEMHLIDPLHVGVAAERSRAYLKQKNFPRWRVLVEYVLMQWRVFHGRQPMTRILRTSLSRALGVLPGLLIAAIHVKRHLATPLQPRSRAS